MTDYRYRSDEITANSQKPDRFVRTSNNGENRISWRWFSGWFMPGFLLVWLLIWWSVILGLAGGIGHRPDSSRDVELSQWELWFKTIQSFEWWASLFPIPLVHILAGIVAAYLLLAILINKTTISIVNNEINVRHHPLPWRAKGPVALLNVESFEARRYMIKSSKGHKKPQHVVTANLRNNESYDLIKLRSAQAQSETEFLAHELNTYL